jgi:hypothetical protein
MNLLSFNCIMIMAGIIFTNSNENIRKINEDKLFLHQFITNLSLQFLIIILFYENQIGEYIRIISFASIIIFIFFLFSYNTNLTYYNSNKILILSY